jgi:hypothetical protein
MKTKIAYLLIFIIVISSFQGLNTYARNIKKDVSSRDYTHTVLVEIATAQSCKPCHYWSNTIQDIYETGGYDFQYVEMIVFDENDEILNDEAADWYSYYSAGSFPKNIMDGDYQRIGNKSDIFIEYLNDCGSREVADISASMKVLWLGNATIQVDIIIENNEAFDYNGHVRASITEIISRYNTYFGEPYHYGFLGFAFDKDISIPGRGVFEDNMTWNGNEQMDNHGNNFGDIDPDNIQVTMGVLNDDDGFVDETTMSYVESNDPPDDPNNPYPADGAKEVDLDVNLTWQCSDPEGDPLTFDIYFGTIFPPPPVKRNHDTNSYNPGSLSLNTTYYWRIVAIDSPGGSTSGPTWSFSSKTKLPENNPPNVEIISPERGVYFRDKKIMPRFIRLTLIIGSINIKVNATDKDSGIERVEFYINNKFLGNDTTEPYEYTWIRDRLRFFHIFKIKVIAYDNKGKSSEDSMIVKKYL